MTFERVFPRAFGIYADGVAREHHFGMQVFVSHDGDVLIDEAVGLLGPDERPLHNDDMMMWMSASKPVAAIALAQLQESRKLNYDDRVSDVIDDFGMYGKASVTIRNILMHTSCFPFVPLPFEMEDWDATIQMICDHPLEEGWAIGETAAYHARSSWFILAELVRRIDGRPYSEYVRDEIFLPLGMNDSWIGMDSTRYLEIQDRLGYTYATAHGRCELLNMHTESVVTSCIPGGNGRGPVRELARLYEMMLNGGEFDGNRIVQPESVTELTHRHRMDNYDHTFKHKMDWGLGFIINSNHHGASTVPYGYGLHASQDTYGHGGRESVTAYADPAHRLVVVAAFNGMPGEPRHNKRVREFNTALYEDLDLA